MTDDLIARLRALSRHEHSDYSIGDEAAAALEAVEEAPVATLSRNDIDALALPDTWSGQRVRIVKEAQEE